MQLRVPTVKHETGRGAEERYFFSSVGYPYKRAGLKD